MIRALIFVVAALGFVAGICFGPLELQLLLSLALVLFCFFFAIALSAMAVWRAPVRVRR